MVVQEAWLIVISPCGLRLGVCFPVFWIGSFAFCTVIHIDVIGRVFGFIFLGCVVFFWESGRRVLSFHGPFYSSYFLYFVGVMGVVGGFWLCGCLVFPGRSGVRQLIRYSVKFPTEGAPLSPCAALSVDMSAS